MCIWPVESFLLLWENKMYSWNIFLFKDPKISTFFLDVLKNVSESNVVLQNNFYCNPQRKVSHPGLAQHEGKYILGEQPI